MQLLAQDLGKISPPPGTVPDVGGNPSFFVAGFVRGGVQLLLIIAFIVALLWTIFAGFRFITAGGDEKAVGSAWSQIYWGLIGLVIVMGSYAIIRLAELIFSVNIITGPFQLPTR